ncbi:unnamed protein product [Clonostachys solani]|uniref:histone acetyltransferase n=1 Tax=Clonostachys solani TaxID=160281 RepID=A0A9N9W3Z9_9HYPO|nr:unnamed protein product [Clonostachys solani]
MVSTMASSSLSEDTLRSRLAAALPKGFAFGIHHVSTPPIKSEALYAAPPKERPERTFVEKHFLAVSIDHPSAENDTQKILVLGLEIYIYTTARATTIFVSKADSTGYLHLLNLPKGTPSPIRTITATFVEFLVHNRRRKGTQLVVSLFARAQDQYLFPGSVEYKGKHVLDDRGLIKWWCRVLNPLLDDPVDGYILVPGLETNEMKAFIPKGTSQSARWSVGHPLMRISHYARQFDWVPPRCLIPQFPDDPKSRFRDELDADALNSAIYRTTGNWKTVRTLDTFWEMMAYRQECSSGRMTGFIWAVYDGVKSKASDEDTKPAVAADVTDEPPSTPSKQRTINIAPQTTPRKLFPSRSDAKPYDERHELRMRKAKERKRRKKLTGPIIPRKVRMDAFQKMKRLLDRPTYTAYYAWGVSGRGELIVSEAKYKRIIDILLHLDFATLEKSLAGTRRWLSEVGLGASWGYTVEGEKEVSIQEDTQDASGLSQVNNLTTLVKRKRSDTQNDSTPQVNVLGAGLIRKKSKAEEEPAKPAVNVLGEGLVRKKPKD